MKPELQSLARIKLIETRRQRDRLQAHYAAIERRAAEAPDALSRMRILHEGLNEVTFARKPLHPEVRHLDALVLVDYLGSAPANLIDERTRFLERELAQGKLRAEFTYAFGQILSEWTAPTEIAIPTPDGQREGIDLLFEPPPARDEAEWWITLESLDEVLTGARERVAYAERSTLSNPVSDDEVQAAFSHLVLDRQRPANFRREAAASRFNADLVHEYAGVLTILLNDLERWDWPGEMELRQVWSRVKYRPHAQEDLITALFLEVLGRRWQQILEPCLLWRSLRSGDKLWFHEEPSSILSEIHNERLERQARRFGAAMAQSSPGNYRQIQMHEGLAHIEAELRLSRALGNTTVRLGQVDLRDYYPTVPHAVIRDVLARLGVSERWLAFFDRFLAVPVVGRGRIQRGMPLEHTLTDLFGEVVLWVLDLYVWRSAGVAPLRVVDDIVFIPQTAEQGQRALAAIERFCAWTGLSINPTKSGSVGLDRNDPLPHWGMLQLRPDGVWDLDEHQIQRYEEVLRYQLTAASSVLDFVRIYNDSIHYIVARLVPDLVLDPKHLQRISARVSRLHDSLFGERGGVVDEIRRRIGKLFDDALLSPAGIPEALLYWPVTAGGLGLVHPLFEVATYIQGSRVSPPEPPRTRAIVEALFRSVSNPLTAEELATIPDTVAHKAPRRQDLTALIDVRPTDPRLFSQALLQRLTASAWLQFYTSCVHEVPETGPTPMPSMERLVGDLIQRGSEVSGRTQMTLTPYWRWIVYTYGPALLEALGTFRFLLTELVPMTVIVESRGGTLGSNLGPEEAPPNAMIARPVSDDGDSIPF